MLSCSFLRYHFLRDIQIVLRSLVLRFLPSRKKTGSLNRVAFTQIFFRSSWLCLSLTLTEVFFPAKRYLISSILFSGYQIQTANQTIFLEKNLAKNTLSFQQNIGERGHCFSSAYISHHPHMTIISEVMIEMMFSKRYLMFAKGLRYISVGEYVIYFTSFEAGMSELFSSQVNMSKTAQLKYPLRYSYSLRSMSSSQIL